jgi:hypothetical protein
VGVLVLVEVCMCLGLAHEAGLSLIAHSVQVQARFGSNIQNIWGFLGPFFFAKIKLLIF